MHLKIVSSRCSLQCPSCLHNVTFWWRNSIWKAAQMFMFLIRWCLLIHVVGTSGEGLQTPNNQTCCSTPFLPWLKQHPPGFRLRWCSGRDLSLFGFLGQFSITEMQRPLPDCVFWSHYSVHANDWPMFGTFLVAFDWFVPLCVCGKVWHLQLKTRIHL